MKHTTGICFNCGADNGLHHYETLQCPKNGIEIPLNKKQEWDQRNTFEDSGLVKLHAAAPLMYQEHDVNLSHCDVVIERIAKGEYLAAVSLLNLMKDNSEQAIKKATE